ncbi:MAG TPA: hypothetical protein VIY49_11935 [Bryobacteraceae bacterium]
MTFRAEKRTANALCASKKVALPIVASVLAFWCALVPATAQRGGGKAAPKVSRPAEPAPRWPDGHVNLGSSPGHKGYWELRPGFGPRPTNVPFLPWAKEVYDYRQKSQVSARPPYIDCKASPGPEFLLAPGFDIVEAPELKSVFIMNIAGPHSWRVIHMDRSDHPKDLRPTYLGDSFGKWDSDTLVIDTVGFNEKIWPFNSYPTTSQLHLIERFSRPTLGSLVYEMTIDDPGAYSAPWGGKTQISESTPSRWVDNGEMFEYICEDDR